MRYPEPFEKLIQILQKMPGVGRRTAERYAFDIFLRWKETEIESFAERVKNLPVQLTLCSICSIMKEQNKPCIFCNNESRNKQVLCIVASQQDVYAIEKTEEFQGLYHVLPGLLSPIEGKGEDYLDIERLKIRLKNGIQEVILALDSSLEGDATCLYIKEIFKNEPIRWSRLAFGIPLGSSLEYVDGGTLARAFHGRVIM